MKTFRSFYAVCVYTIFSDGNNTTRKLKVKLIEVSLKYEASFTLFSFSTFIYCTRLFAEQ